MLKISELILRKPVKKWNLLVASATVKSIWLTRAFEKAVFLMMSPKRQLRVAIAGGRGIGRVHARIFHALGANVCAVLGSSQESAEDVAWTLETALGTKIQPFHQLDSLLEESKPDAITICTPPHLHFEGIMAAFNRSVPVFCEKPLFWHKKITQGEVKEKLATIRRHPNRRFFINTCNVNFLDHVVERFGVGTNIQSFYFQFYSRGKHVQRDIAADLLPHGLSLVLRLLGNAEIINLTEDTREHSYKCQFQYNGSAVEFDFQENSDGPKALTFAINGRAFTRIQEGGDATYRVYLKDSYTGKITETQDPFQLYIKRFLDCCNQIRFMQQDDFDEAAANLRLMANILLGKLNAQR